jgi:HYDIN/CFA65/VesB-like, Ig-like domain
MHRSSRIVAALAALSLILLAPVAAQAAKKPPPTLAWSPSGSYDFGTLTSGTKSAETFMLTNSGDSASGALSVTLALSGSSAGFTKTADTCTSVSLKVGGTCSVTVQYAFTAAGQTDTATLTATTKKASASVTLSGASVPAGPNLTIGSPAQFTGTSAGTNDYSFSWGSVAPPPNGLTQTFTVTNAGGSPGQISFVPVTFVYGQYGSPYSAEGTCIGATLGPGQSCDFTITVGGATCEGFPSGTVIDNVGDWRVENADQTFAYDYLHVTWSWVCP